MNLTEEQIQSIKMSDEYIKRHNIMSNKGYDIKRKERNNLLSATDKYMMEDFPITYEQKEQMKIYRQQLRDVPLNNYIFPEKPPFMKELNEEPIGLIEQLPIKSLLGL